jgi:hypothetical protein
VQSVESKAAEKVDCWVEWKVGTMAGMSANQSAVKMVAWTVVMMVARLADRWVVK